MKYRSSEEVTVEGCDLRGWEWMDAVIQVSGVATSI